MSTKANVLVIRLIPLVAGLTVAGVLAWIVYAAGNTSMAKGIVIGASATLALAVVLWVRGSRGGTAARLASGEGDERDRHIMTLAAADGAFVMLVAGVVGLVGAVFGWPAVAALAVVIWAGLLAIAISFAVRTRRG